MTPEQALMRGRGQLEGANRCREMLLSGPELAARAHGKLED
jgi:hypothetical protein